ncbi:hypothetical protein PUMCH_003040 [Australozyma saopauloensis]|uniref:Gamma-glutamyltransferase n=1 Tax=Australozyma saopauloensis TaxID=291208 RepID=A0AAX4HB23_9ASCO|nr:hypothetical protein PUMCH_003040 [[Candida] saopauloensis]
MLRYTQDERTRFVGKFHPPRSYKFHVDPQKTLCIEFKDSFNTQITRMFNRFSSRRSVVYSCKGMVASSQPLANAAGIRILEKGGNCVDAAVAVSAALCVTEPPSTGVGGDCFVLFYDGETKEVHGINGSGKAPADLSIEVVREKETEIIGPRLPLRNVHSVTVPGAIAGWLDAIEKWGSKAVSLEEIFAPAISLAENGFAVAEVSAQIWRDALNDLIRMSGDNAKTFLNEDGSFCEEGQIFRNPKLASLFRKVSLEGKDGFYRGDVAEKIVEKIRDLGGVMQLSDLANHTSKFVDPIKLSFMGKLIWEIPPNGQGIVALFALGYIRELADQRKIDLESLEHNLAEYLHLLIEALKLAFYDSEHFVADLDFHKDIDLEKAISKGFIEERSRLIDMKKVLTREDVDIVPNPMYQCDTVYFTVTDQDGNACSFINSVFSPFGSCIIPDDYGFALQSRGANFNLSHKAINCLEGGKRPYHTIIPSLITDDSTGELYASVACMGGWEQPQAHVQIFLNLVLFGFSPQEALDAPRFCLEPDESGRHLDVGKGSFGPVSTPATLVRLEEGITSEVFETLRLMGHEVNMVTGHAREVFGRAQCIKNIVRQGKRAWAGGSDMRGDGAAVPQI